MTAALGRAGNSQATARESDETRGTSRVRFRGGPPPLASPRVLLFAMSIAMFIYTIGLRASALDDFKRFMESPPVIEELRYIHFYPGRTNEYPVTYHFARYQSGAFVYLRALTADEAEGQLPSDLKSTGFIHGHFDQVFWNISGPWRVLTIWQDIGNLNERTNEVRHACESAEEFLGNLLNMGVQHGHIGIIRWDGDRFSLTNRSHGVEWYIDGSVRPDQQGRAAELEVHVGSLQLEGPERGRRRTVPWKIRYDYNSILSLPFLPSTITTYAEINGKEQLLDQYRIAGIEVSASALPAQAFSPEPFLNPRTTTRFYLTNNVIGYFDKGVWRKRLEPKDPRISQVPRHFWIRQSYFALAAALALPLVVIMIKQIVKQRKE